MVFLVGVRSSQSQLSSLFSIGVSVQPESKDGGLNNSLLNHRVEWRGDMVDRDLREAHTKNTIKLGSKESESRFMGSFSKELISHTNTSNADSVLGYKA